MMPFSEILERAIARHSMAEIEAQMPTVLSPAALSATGDDRWLATMAKQIFRAGFSWKVIDAKWPGFEAAFDGFEPRRVAMYADEDLDRLLSDKAIVRNGPKIRAVIDNARFLVELADQHGSAGRFLAEWPDDDYVGLLEFLKKRGGRLGGNTGQMVLRIIGKPAFVLSEDVSKALIMAGVVDKKPSSKRDMAKTQVAFDAWAEETGRNLSELSRILAMSV